MKESPLSRVVACLLITPLLPGCTTPDKGPKDGPGDVDQISGLLQKWKAAFLAEDLNTFMALYSENFVSNGRNKEAIAADIKATMRKNVADDVKVNVEIATITVRGDKATVLPIALCRRTGSGTIRLELARERGRWLIVGMDSK